ncbi:MAG: hypothetical protein ACYTF1_02325 [Planctomycetota bacterium]
MPVFPYNPVDVVPMDPVHAGFVLLGSLLFMGLLALAAYWLHHHREKHHSAHKPR